jgi:hypothetical protein
MSLEEKFYCYIYCDTRKPGNYVYKNYQFDYEPFYVGKGQGYRYRNHLFKSSMNSDRNKLKINKIKKILEETGNEPLIIRIGNFDENSAIKWEKFLIEIIGWKDLNKGPLTNLTDGGDGVSGVIQTEDHKQKFQNGSKKYWTAEKRKEYGKNHRGKNNNNFGNKWSKEQRKRASEYSKVNSNFVKNNPQKINPNIGEKVGKNKWCYLIYNSEHVLIDKNNSATTLSEKYKFVRSCITKYANTNKIYHGYYINKVRKEDKDKYEINNWIYWSFRYRNFKRRHN